MALKAARTSRPGAGAARRCAGSFVRSGRSPDTASAHGRPVGGASGICFTVCAARAAMSTESPSWGFEAAPRRRRRASRVGCRRRAARGAVGCSGPGIRNRREKARSSHTVQRICVSVWTCPTSAPNCAVECGGYRGASPGNVSGSASARPPVFRATLAVDDCGVRAATQQRGLHPLDVTVPGGGHSRSA